MNLEFVPFSSISGATWLTVLNNPEVHRHMPLAGKVFTEAEAVDWATGKDRQWVENGYGPWAIRIDGIFAGWGGFQKEGDEADLGLVLLPAFWGVGHALHRALIDRGFGELGLTSVSILLPPSRTRLTALARLGYHPAGDIEYDGHRFLKFRLGRPQ